MPPADRPLTILTDYGVGSEYVGALHLAVVRVLPTADRIDLAHDIPPGDVRWGALVLARHAPALPGAVHLAVVDPGVGGSRRPLAIALDDGGFLVGPDNGLLGPALDAVGARAAVELHPPPTSAPRTFHGRDLFAPAAARLCAGTDIALLGREVDPSGVIRPAIEPPEIAGGTLTAEVAGRDRFGNISLLATRTDLIAAGLGSGTLVIEGPDGREFRATTGTHFADVAPDGLVVYEDSNRVLSVARRDGDAWGLIGCAPRSRLVLTAHRT